MPADSHDRTGKLSNYLKQAAKIDKLLSNEGPSWVVPSKSYSIGSSVFDDFTMIFSSSTVQIPSQIHFTVSDKLHKPSYLPLKLSQH